MKFVRGIRGATVLAVLFFFAGCSDKSRMNLRILEILGESQGNSGGTFIQADLMGQVNGLPCTALAIDTVRVTLLIEKAGSVGPTFDAYVTAYNIDYFYYDPRDGQLRGPIGELAVRDTNIREYLPVNRQERIVVPVVPMKAKMWAVGVTCPVHGLNTAWPDPATRIWRMVARIMIIAEDETGKTASDHGDILIHFDNYAPDPVAPVAGAAETVDNWCWDETFQSYWAAYCR